jgi:hypothetical protein
VVWEWQSDGESERGVAKLEKTRMIRCCVDMQQMPDGAPLGLVHVGSEVGWGMALLFDSCRAIKGLHSYRCVCICSV